MKHDTPTLFLSPTEHLLRPQLDALSIPHRNSPLCEQNGVDVIVPTRAGLIGFQRKTLKDLYASFSDGRWSLELGQIRSSSLLARAVLLLELDRRRTTADGRAFIDVPMSALQLRNTLLKAQLNNLLIVESVTLAESASLLLPTSNYLSTTSFQRLSRPGPATDSWGRRTSRDFGIHLLQSFPNIGPTTAAAIYDALSIPLAFTCTLSDLTSIPGIGKLTAERLLAVLTPAATRETKPQP
jgi:ERCC4-type nuclease